MISDETHLKQLLFTAVTNVMNDSPDVARCDLDELSTLLWKFASASEMILDDHARYETYYTVLGKAVTIAIAFRDNCLSEMTGKEETRAKVLEYLTKTYGIQTLRDREL